MERADRREAPAALTQPTEITMSLPTNGLPLVSSYAPIHQAGGWERVAADTYLASGVYPQTIGMTSFDIAALAAGLAANASTEVANAVTSNVLHGTITTASLSTAAGSTHVVTLTNSAITTSSVVRANIYSKTNTTTGAYITVGTPGSGSVVFTITNGNASSALNGTMVIPFAVSTQ